MEADSDRPPALAAWHALAQSRDPAALADLLHENAVFRSPAVHTPQQGKALTTAYLTAALTVLGPTLRYLDEWYDHDSAVLEFEAVIGEGEQRRTVHGVDMMRWDEAGLITSFTVMARPMKGLEALIGAMVTQLAR